MFHDVCFVSAKDKGEKKLFGFAFTPLMREDGTTLSDESHELYVYKVGAVVNMQQCFSLFHVREYRDAVSFF